MWGVKDGKANKMDFWGFLDSLWEILGGERRGLWVLA